MQEQNQSSATASIESLSSAVIGLTDKGKDHAAGLLEPVSEAVE